MEEPTQIQRRGPVQCEDQPNPNHFIIVYENHSYEHHLQNEMMCEEHEVDKEGDAMIVLGEWTNNVAATIEDEVETDAPLNIVVQTEQSHNLLVPALDLSDRCNVNPEFRRFLAYTNEPERKDALEASEKEDLHCDSLSYNSVEP